MGKRARQKKEERLSQLLQEKRLVEARRRQARSPMVRLFGRLIWAIIITIILLYFGQVVNQKIVQAAANNEVVQP